MQAACKEKRGERRKAAPRQRANASTRTHYAKRNRYAASPLSFATTIHAAAVDTPTARIMPCPRRSAGQRYAASLCRATRFRHVVLKSAVAPSSQGPASPAFKSAARSAEGRTCPLPVTPVSARRSNDLNSRRRVAVMRQCAVRGAKEQRKRAAGKGRACRYQPFDKEILRYMPLR